MELDFSQAQLLLRRSARDFLERECHSGYVRDMEKNPNGFKLEMWDRLVEMEWVGLPFPEEVGGGGADFLDLCLLLEEMGRALLPGPYFSTVVLAGLTLLDAGSPEQQEQLLTPIARGQLLATMAVTEESARWDAAGIADVRAIRRDTQYILNGTKLFVQDAHSSDYLLVAARTRHAVHPERGITLLLVPSRAPGVQQTPLVTLAGDRQSAVTFTDVRVPTTAVLGQEGGGWPVLERSLRRAAAAKACELVGTAQRVLEMTVEYVKTRTQFGRPVGSFQAVQHQCADMAVEVEGARYAAYRAAWALAQGQGATEEVALAKAWAGDAARRVCELAHQCHGAIGFTQEYNLQLYTRRARTGELLYGDSDFHRETVARAMRL